MKRLLFLSVSLLASTPLLQGVLPEDEEAYSAYPDEDTCCCYDPEFDDIRYGNSEDIIEGIQEIACYAVNKLTVLESKQIEIEKRLSALESE